MKPAALDEDILNPVISHIETPLQEENHQT